MNTLTTVLFLLGVTSLAAGRQVSVRSDGCPEPYGRLDDTRCILVDPYVSRTYTQTLDYCTTHGGKMIYMENCDDLTLIFDYIHVELGLDNHHFWLGATDEQEEGVWKWTHNNKPVPMGLPYWHVNEPNDGESKNCAILHYSYNHRWTDIECNKAYNAICLRNA